MLPPNSPFAKFTDKINKDLLAWTLRKQQYEALAKDYENTLKYLQLQKNVGGNVLVDLGCGEGVFSEGKRIDGNIIIRMKQDLYVQFRIGESEKVLKELFTLYKQKIKVAECEIRKITASMKQVQELIQQYSSLA